jgi:probable F420-dependent oxidoreductase
MYPYDRVRADPDAFIEVVQLAETLGFDVLSLPEHLLPPPEATAMLANETWYDLPVLASYMAAKTTRIKFLLGVLVLPYHPPIGLAKQLATLDIVSKGRVLCGIGAGWYEDEFKRLGIPFAERGDITDEYVQAMIELWTAPRPHFSGRFVSFSDVTFEPKPMQKPHIPILVGGSGPRPFRRVAELGEGWQPMTGSLEVVTEQFAGVRKAVAQAGRDPEGLWFGYSMTMGIDPETQRARQHAGGATSSDMRRTANEAITELTRIQAAGVNYVSIGFNWQTPAELALELRRFAAEVLPAFR